MPQRSWRSLHAVLASVSVVIGCSNDATSTEPVGTHLEVLQGPGAVGLPGYPLWDSVVVEVRDDDGLPRAGVLLRWVARQRDAVVSADTARTDSLGRSAVLWTLGSDEGAQELEVRTLDDSSRVIEAEARRFRMTRFANSGEKACAVSDGDIYCWGETIHPPDAPASRVTNHHGLGGDFPATGRITAGADFTDLALDTYRVCGLRAAGTIACYRLDVGWAEILNSSGSPTVPPLRVLRGASVNYCGLAVADSTAWCWVTNATNATQLPASPAFLDLRFANSSGVYTACGLRVDSTAACWGRFSSASIGSDTAQAVTGAHKFVELAVGRWFACGRTADGEAWCWGDNSNRVLGDNRPGTGTPVLVASGVLDISAEDARVIARTLSGVLRWGSWAAAGPELIPALADLPVTSLTPGGVGCVGVLGGGIECYEDLWSNAGGTEWDDWYPVMPAVEGPLPSTGSPNRVLP